MKRYYTTHVVLAMIIMVAVGCSASRDGAHYQKLEFLGTTLEGDTVQIPSVQGLPTAIIFYNGYSCKDCFTKANAALDTLLKTNEIGRISVLARVGSSAFAQREALRTIQHIMRPDLPVLFDLIPDDVTDPWPPHDLVGGLFGRFQIEKTPALLLADNITGRVAFLDYEALGFSSDEEGLPTSLSSALVERIQSELKVFEKSIGRQHDTD